MHKIYVASSWRNKIQPNVVALLRANGHQVYDFRNPPNGSGFAWLDLDAEWESWTAKEYRRKLLTDPRAASGYMSDMRAMEWADTCVLVLPSGRSAHLEAGWFAGRGKQAIILTGDGEEPELMALMANSICVNMDEVLHELET